MNLIVEVANVAVPMCVFMIRSVTMTMTMTAQVRPNLIRRTWLMRFCTEKRVLNRVKCWDFKHAHVYAHDGNKHRDDEEDHGSFVTTNILLHGFALRDKEIEARSEYREQE